MFKTSGPFRVVSFAEFDINLAVSRNHIKLLSVVALEMLIPHYYRHLSQGTVFFFWGYPHVSDFLAFVLSHTLWLTRSVIFGPRSDICCPIGEYTI